MDPHFGKVYHSLRLSKRLTLKEIASDDLSVSTISRFENEKSSLTIEKFYQALKAINITMSEFESYHEASYDSETFPMMRVKVVDAYRSGSITKLEVIKRNLAEGETFQERQRNQLYRIVIDASIYTLDSHYPVAQDDVDLLYQYLVGIKSWTSFEIWLMASSAMIFSEEQIRFFSEDFFGRFHLYSTDELTFSRTLLALHNLINAALAKEVYDAAFHLLNSVEKVRLTEMHMEPKLFLLYDQGWYDAVTGKREKGLAQMRKVQEIIAFIDTSSHLADMFRAEIDELERNDFHLNY